MVFIWALRSGGGSITKQIICVVWIANGVVQIRGGNFEADWREHGIVGRSSEGRLYPKDGHAFVEELRYMYRGSYCWAEYGSGPVEEAIARIDVPVAL